jgi:hypothetical protein
MHAVCIDILRQPLVSLFMHLWPTYYTLEIRVYILNLPQFSAYLQCANNLVILYINNCCINCTTLYESSIMYIYGASRLPPFSGDSNARTEPQRLG